MAETKQVLVVGAGDFGREVASWLKDVEGMAFVGFLDDDAAALVRHPTAGRIVGTIKEYRPDGEQVLAMGISDPKVKLQLAEELRGRGATFVSVVHPTVVLGERVTIGTGCVLCPRVVISCDAEVGDFVTLNVGCSIGHDTRTSAGATVSSHCDLMGWATLERGAFLGSHASVLPRGTVGEFGIVGAGSVVLRRAPANATVMGVPARRIPTVGAA